jgi:Peptidogalycan biosysnthesis/recognition
MISHFSCNKKEKITLQDIDIQYFSTLKQIKKSVWNQGAAPDDVFLQYDYLSVLENFPPANMSFAYVIFFNEKNPIGVAYFQVSPFDASASIKDTSSTKYWIAKQLKFNVLVIGNALLTGEHGFHFSETITQAEQEKLLLQAVEKVQLQCENEQRKIGFQLAKDFYTPRHFLEKDERRPVLFSPSMILDLKPEWNTFEDYLAAMLTKYRTRAKRAEKKREGLKTLELDMQAIEDQSVRMYELYKKIAEGADFNHNFVHEKYFIEMKRTFGSDFKVLGYFEQNRLVGYCTTLLNHDELETGFLGFEDAYNTSHQIYLNFLYDMIKTGIENRVKKVVFSRTALEIKSSVGAEPHSVYTYLKHHNQIINHLIPSIVKRIAPSQDWVQRHPFKSVTD